MEHTEAEWRGAATAIKAAIEDAGGQRKCAEAIGIPQSTLSRKCNGHEPFNLRELWRISAYLNTDVGRLVA